MILLGSRGDISEAKIATNIIKKSQKTEIKAHLFLIRAIKSLKKDDEVDELPFDSVSLEVDCDLLIILFEDQVLHIPNQLSN